MKKIIYIVALVLLVTGCSRKDGTITCTSTSTPNEEVKLKSTYIITYKNNYVTKLKTTEIITVKDKSNIETYKNVLENSYKEYNKIKYYSNVISVEDNNLISSTIINYDKINTNKLIKLDKNNQSIIKNKKVAVDDIKNVYVKNGCKCK